MAIFRQVQFLHQRFDDGGSRNDDIGPVGIDAGNFPPAIEGERTQQVDHAAELRGGHGVSLDQAPPVRRADGDFRQVHDRPGTADHLLDRELPQSLQGSHRPRANIPLDAGILRR
jgi:hypothetical protein